MRVRHPDGFIVAVKGAVLWMWSSSALWSGGGGGRETIGAPGERRWESRE